MKKFLLSIIVFFIVLAAAGYAVLAIDWNRFNKEHYYVQINEKPSIEEFVDQKGAVYKSYWYTLPAYSEDGNMKELHFSAAKELREDAYLMLYVKNEDVVTSYDEVQREDLPSNVNASLND